jgi:hypothetical protein
MRRERRSAKAVITNYANELLMRTTDKDVAIRLTTVEAIAMRMGWNDLYNRLRFRERSPVYEPAIETEEEKPEPWWQR